MSNKKQTNSSVDDFNNDYNYYPYSNYPNNTGWICPRCGQSNAPWIQSCSCNRGVIYTYSSTNQQGPYNVKNSNEE